MGMTKTEAAEILALEITVWARKRGVTQITKDLIEELRGEARHWGLEGCLIRQAAEVCPDWRTIRAAGRRNHNS
jgi:hypothetical protein